jgi:hypothetical protein
MASNFNINKITLDNNSESAEILIGNASPIGSVDADPGSLFIVSAGVSSQLYINTSTSPGPGSTWTLFSISGAGGDHAALLSLAWNLSGHIGTAAQLSSRGSIAVFDDSGATAEIVGDIGEILYHDGTNWVALTAGSTGEVLEIDGSGLPSWAAASGGVTDHAALLSNLAWTSSGHTGTGGLADSIAGFVAGSGAAAEFAIGTDIQEYSADLDALAGLATTGLVVRTGAGTAATRTVTGTAGNIVVTNGNGVLGDPTIDVGANVFTTASADHADLTANLAWTTSLHTGTAGTIATFNALGAASEITGNQGEILYYDGSSWSRLAVGTAGQVLQTNGVGADPTWVTPSSGTTDHALLSNLVWASSAHTGTASTFAAFDGGGAATNLSTTASGGDVGGIWPNLTVSDLSITGAAQSDILYFDGVSWVRLAAGTPGRFLQTQATAPLWSDLPTASDTVEGIIEIATQTEVNAGTSTTLAVTPFTLKNATTVATSLQTAYNLGPTITTAGTTDIAFTLASGDFTIDGAGAVTLTNTGGLTYNNVSGPVAFGNTTEVASFSAFSTGSTTLQSRDTTIFTMTANDAANKTLTISASNAGAGDGRISITSDSQVTIDSPNTTITGNLLVQGTTTTVESEIVNIKDNFLYLNDGYTTTSALEGGFVVNSLPTATNDTVAVGGFTAGVAATSNPTVATTGAATFAAGDFIQVSGAADQENDGLYEVVSHAANVLTIAGVGTTGRTYNFFQNQFATDTTAQGTITKVTVGVTQVDTSGNLQYGYGADTGTFTFDDLATSTGITLQTAYVAGNTITTSAAEGSVVIAGDQTLQVTATNGLDVDTIADFDVTTFDVQMTGTNGFSIDGTDASNITTSSGNLTLSASSNRVIIEGGEAIASAVTISATNAAGGVDINAGSGGVDIDSTNSISIDAAAASNFTTSSGTLTLDGSAGVIIEGNANPVDINSGFGTWDASILQLTSTGLMDLSSGANIDIDAVTSITIDSGNGLSLGAGSASDFTTSSGIITVDGADGINIQGNASEIDITTTGVLDINSGSGTWNASTLDLTATSTVDVTGTVVAIDSTAGAITMDAVGGGISLDGAAASNFTTTTGALTLDGNGGVNIAGNASEVDITTTGTIDINGGTVTVDSTGSISIDAAAASNFTTSVGAVTINGAGGINIEGNASEIDLTTTGAVDINAATVEIDSSSTFSIDGVGASNVTVDSGSLTLSTTTAGAVILSSSDNIDIDAVNGVTIDGSGASSFTIDSGDLTISTTTSGTVVVQGIDPVEINRVGGLNTEIVKLTQTTGSNFGIFAGSAAPTFSADAGDLFIRVDGSSSEMYQNTSSPSPGNTWTQFALGTSVSDLQTAYEGGNTITTSAAEGSVVISGDQTLQITTSGGLDVDTVADFDVTTFDVQMTGTNGFSIDGTDASNVTTSSGDLTLSAAANSVVIDGGEAAADAVTITASNAAGGIDINAGTGGITIDAAAASSFTTSAGALTLDGAGGITIEGNAGAVDVNSGVGTWDASSLALTTTGLLDLNAGANMDVDVTGTFDLLSTGTFSIDGTGSSNITATSGDLLVSTDVAGAVVVTSAANVDINAATSITVDAATGISIDAGAASNFTTSVGAITIDGGDGLNLQGNASEIDITTSGPIDINSGAATWDATTLSLDATDDTNLTMTANDGAAHTLTIAASNAGAGTASINISADEDFTVDSSILSLDATDNTNLSMAANDGGTKILRIDASNSGAGTALIDINADEDITIDSTAGAVSIDSSAASNFTTSSGDLTLSATANSVIVDGAEAAADAVRINASNLAGGIDIDAGTAGIDISTTGALSADATGQITIGGTNASAVEVQVAGAANSEIITLTQTTGESFGVFAGTTDPSGSVTADAGSLFVRDTGSGAELYQNTSTGSGTTWAQFTSGSTSVPTGNTIWVDSVNGNDSTGAADDLGRPFLTIAAAIAASSTGDTIQLLPGNYPEDGLDLTGLSLIGLGGWEHTVPLRVPPLLRYLLLRAVLADLLQFYATRPPAQTLYIT